MVAVRAVKRGMRHLEMRAAAPGPGNSRGGCRCVERPPPSCDALCSHRAAATERRRAIEPSGEPSCDGSPECN
eukprot:8476476-Lingulodinium_polyedra.AAC.1